MYKRSFSSLGGSFYFKLAWTRGRWREWESLRRLLLLASKPSPRPRTGEDIGKLLKLNLQQTFCRLEEKKPKAEKKIEKGE